MARHDRRPGFRPEAPAPPQPPPVPVVASPTTAPSPAPRAACGALQPPAAPLRLVALTSIHGGRIAPGDEIPASIAAQLTEGEHWHRAP